MIHVEVFVPGHPKGQPRTRAFVSKKTGRAGAFDPGTADEWKGMVALALGQHAPKTPSEAAIHLEIDFLLPRPKRLLRKRDPVAEIPHTSKPDIDNAVKAVMDTLTALQFWHDDAQVCSLLVTKSYQRKDGRCGARIRVQEIPRQSGAMVQRGDPLAALVGAPETASD